MKKLATFHYIKQRQFDDALVVARLLLDDSGISVCYHPGGKWKSKKTRGKVEK